MYTKSKCVSWAYAICISKEYLIKRTLIRRRLFPCPKNESFDVFRIGFVRLLVLDSKKQVNMSDDEDIADQDFDYDNDDNEDEPEDDLENQYYFSEALIDDDPSAALESFQNVLSLEKKSGTKGDWGFKSLDQMTKIYLKKKNYEKMLDVYKEL